MVIRRDIGDQDSQELQHSGAEQNHAGNSYPAVYLPDASFLLDGNYEKAGFDLVITNPAGETFIVKDYFAFNPPPNLMLSSGAGLSPEMVARLMHLPFGADVMFAGPATSPGAMIEIGEVRFVRGDVRVKRADGSEITLKKGDILYQGDEILTGPMAFIRASMKDGTRFHLGRNGRATLDKYEFSEAETKGTFEATVVKGGFHYKSGKIGQLMAPLGQKHSTISTPTAVIGIRGSELDGHVADDGSTTVRHTSGILEITDINGNNPVELTQPGTGTVILLGGSPEGFTQLPPQYNEQLNQNLPPSETPEEAAEEDDGQEEVEDEAPSGEPGDEDGPGDDETGSDEQITDEAPVEDDNGEDDGDEDAGEEDPDAGEGEEETRAEGDGEPAEDLTGADDRSGSSAREAGTGEPGDNDAPPAEDSAGSAGNETDSESDTGDETPTSSTSRQTEEVDVTGQETGTRTTTPGNTGSGSRPGTQKTGAATTQVESDSEESDDTEEPVAEELPPDNPPVAVDDVLQVDSAGSREISAFLLQNDRDADAGQTPRIIGISGQGSRGGTVSFANGRVTYTPDADQLGSLGAGNTATETFTYRVQTGDLTDSATLTVRLVGSNRAPVAQDDSAVAVEDTPITINVIGNDTDPDGDSLSVISVDGGRGTISNSSSAGLQYTPPDDLRAGEVITDTFTYTVSDGELSSTATVSVTVTGRNDPPVIKTNEEPFEVQASAGPTEIPLSAIFADSDLGDQLTVVSIDTSGTRSTVTIGSIIVDPGDVWDFLARGEIGRDSFGVTVRDEFNATGSGRYTFEVIGVNDAPVANADQYSLIGGEPNRIDEQLGLLANDTDVDNGAELTVSAITTRPASGSLSFSADGSFVYTPADGFLGTDQFVYQVTDEFGAVSSARVTLNVGATNEPPVANPDQFTISNSGVVTGNLLANDLDQEGEPITASLATPPANGTVSVSVDGSFTYAPEPDFTGTDTFTYEVSDSGGRTSEGTVTVEVLGQNEPPVATSPGNQSIAVDEPFSLDLNSVFSDPEGTPLVYSFSSTSGLVTLSGATLIIDPAGANAGDAFDVVVTASDGENTTSTSFSVDVVSGNSPPELVAPISPISIAEGGNLVVGLGSRFTDPDGDPLTIFSSGQPAFVTLSGNSLSITPQSGDAGTYSIVVGADDGQSTATTSFSLTVTPPVLPPNVAPVITAPASISLIEDTSFSPVISISDADAGTDPILVSLSGPGAISITGPASLYGSTQLGSSTLGQGVAPGGEIFIRFDLVDASFKNAVSPAGVFMYTAGAQIAADSIVDGGAAGDSSFTARFVSPAADPFAPWSFAYFNTQLQTFSAGGTFDAAFYNTAADALVESNVVSSELGVPLFITNYQLEGTVDDVNTTLTSLSVQPFADFNTATSAATFSIFVNDLGNNGGAPATSSASIQLDITPVPDPPQANDIFYGNYVEDYTGVISINASLYSYDPDGDPLTVTAIDGNAILANQTVLVANGSVTLQADSQTLEFEADAEYSGPISFGYTISDGSSTAAATITLTISPVNDSPVITAPASITSLEDQAFSPVISVSDVDAGAGNVTVFLSVPGDISISGPAALSSAPFAYTSLGQPFAAGNQAFVRFDYSNATIKDVSAFDIRFVKNGSVVYSDAIVAGGGVGDTFVVASFTPTVAVPFDGSEFVNANVELENFTGTVTYDSSVFASLGDAVAQSNPVQTTIGIEVEFTNYTLIGSIADVNTTLSTLSIQPRPGYNNTDYSASLDVTVDDQGNSGGFSSPAFVSIPLDITPVNDPPVANSDSYVGVQEDQSFTFNPTINDSDPEFDTLTITEINAASILPTQSVAVTNGTITLQADGQTLEFTPDAEYAGPVAFDYTISDGSSTATSSVTLTVNAVNDAPVISAPASITTLEDQSFSPVISISDADAGSGSIQVEINAPGEIFISGPVSLSGFVNTYALLNQSVAAGNEVFIRFDYGNATIKSAITVSDIWIFNNGGQLFADSITAGGGVGETFVTARFVSPVADPFTTFSSVNVVAELENISSIVTRDAAVYNTSADALAQSNAASTDLGMPLAFNNYQLTGTVADINTALSTLSVQPFPDTNTGTSTANFFVSVNDLGNSGGPAALDSVVIPVSITPVNDLPVANNDGLGSYPEDFTGTITLNPTLNDYDPELAPLTITGIDGNSILPNGSVAVANGTVTLLGDGQTLEFQADPDYFGAISFDYAVSDGTATATATVSLSLFAVNDPPVADAESFTVLEGGTATEANLDAGTSLLDGDTDVDGDTLTATTLSAPAFASAFTLNPDGTFSYTHDGSANFTDSFVYRISDGLNTDTATVSISVTQTPFLISPDFDTVIINAGDSISLPIGFSDPDFDALTTSAIGLPGWASVSTSIPSPPGDAVISGTALTGTSTVTVSATDGVGTATETFVLDAQASADLQVGTAGNDLFLGSDGNDTIQGGAGDDEILYAGNQSDYTYTATYSAGVVTITVTDNVGTDGVDVITGVESIQFADGPLSGPLTINGSSLADTITGSQGADIINGNNGSDIIDGLGGNDTIDGGALDDNLVGGDGDDVIYGGIGADVLTGGSGNDVLDGNDAGNLGDTEIDIAVFSGNSSDYDISPDPLLAGATGTLTFTVTDLVGTDGTDTVSDIERLQFADVTIDLPYDLRGSSLADVLTGGSLADYIVAINGDDTVNGLAGDDYVDAGAGDDVIDGGDGADTILGGPGQDTFVLQDANDSTATSVDIITDFTAGEDVIKFEGMSGITLDPVPFAYNPGGVAATIVDIVADVGISDNAVFFQDSTDGYLYIKGAGVGTSFDGTLVKLSGVLTIPADIDFDPVLGAGNALPQGSLQLLDTFGDFTIHDGTSFNVLTVDTTSLSDANGLGTFSYQWYSDASPVGIDSPNYTTTQFDVGTQVYVEVSYIDGGSNPESVFSHSVYIAPQNPDVAGIETYVMSFMDDFVFGSPGNDTITLLGLANGQDYVDLGDGFDTLNLADPSNSIRVENVEVITGGSLTDTITVQGSLNTLDGILSNRTGLDTIINEGFIGLDNEVTSGAGDFQNTATGVLRLAGSTGSSVTFDSFSSNYGTVVLRGTGTSTLTVTTTPFNNEKLFAVVDDGQAVTHVFNGDFVNGPGGFLSVLEDFQVNGSLDMREGGGRVTTGKTLTMGHLSTLYVDDSTFFFEPDGALSFTGTSTVDVTGNYFINSGNPYHDFSQGNVTVDGTGTFTLGIGGQLEFTADVVNADFHNQGELVIRGGSTAFNGVLTADAAGTITLDANSTDGSSQLDVSSAFVNYGTIVLDNTDVSGATAWLQVNGGFTNAGTIEVLDTGGGLTGTGTGVHTISGVFDNDPGGYFYIQGPVALDGTGANHINDGTSMMPAVIDLDGGTLFISGATSFTNGFEGRIEGAGAINSTVAIIQQGFIDPQGNGAGVIAFDGGLDLEPSSVLLLDVFDLVGDHDQVTVSGGALDVEGNLDLTFLDTTGLSATSTTTISTVISYASLGSNQAFTNVYHNLGTGYLVDVVPNGTSYDVQIVPSFALSFDNGLGDGLWSSTSTSTTNWDPDTLPGSSDSVLINGYTVTHDATFSEVGSIALINSTLNLENGELRVNQPSLVDTGSVLNISPGTGTATLTIEEGLSNAGTINWDDGTITSTTTTGFIQNLGTFNINPEFGLFLEAGILNLGTVNIVNAGSISGNVMQENDGQMNIQGSVNLDIPFKNHGDGAILLGSSSSDVDVTHSQNISSDGVYTLDTPGTGTATFNTTLTLNNGTFTNNGVFQISDSGTAGGSRSVTLGGSDFFNYGLMSVDADLHLDIESSLFDTETGSIEVANSVNLNIDGGVLGGTVDLSGATSIGGQGNINFVGDVTLNLITNMFLDAPGIFFDTTGGTLQIVGAVGFGIQSGTSLGLNSNDSIATTQFDNFGNLSLTGDNVSVSADFFNLNGSNLEINGTGNKLIDDTSSTTFNIGLENNGNIVFNQSGTGTNLLDIRASGSGVLNNHGYIQSLDLGSAENANILEATLINSGTLDLQYDFVLNETFAPVQHSNYGEIFLGSGATLSLGTDNDLYNEYDGRIAGSGTLDVSGTNVDFLNDGYILPGGFSTTGVFTIAANAATQFSRASIYEIELNGTTPGSGHDQLVISKSAANLRGRLDIRVLSPFVPTAGQSFTIVSTVGLPGLWQAIDGTDVYADHGVVFDLDVISNDVILTARTPTVTGTLGDNVLVATGGADIVYADDGNDVVLDIGVDDVVFGGFGDDFLEVTNRLFKRIDGGEGIDTLRFSGIPLVDLTNEDGFFIDSIEVLNFDDGTPQTIQLDADSIRYLADEGNDLLFGEDAIIALGDSTDHLILFGDFLVDGAGTKSFDVRSPGEFEDFTRLYTTTTGTTSIYIDQQMLTEVQRTDGAKRFFGSAGDDNITSTSTQTQTTGNIDWLFGRGGDDFLDGGGGSDAIYGGEGNDTILYDAADAFTPVEGGNGVDTLIDLSASASIDLSGVTNLKDFEVIDLADGDGNDVLSLGLTDILSFVRDNSLDSILPDGQTKLIINGDSGDVLNLDANTLGLATDFGPGGLVDGWSAPNGNSELDYFGNGSSYVLFSNGIVDVYVHADMIAPI